MSLETYVRATLTELVRVPSSADAGTAAILRVAADAVVDLGLRPKIHRASGAITAASGQGGVLLNGHLDTVPLGAGWTHAQATWAGDWLYGRGTADMKAGCVAALAAARELLRGDVPFSLLFTTDEETTMKGSIDLASSDLVREAAAVVVGEPSALNVIASEKGVLWYHATTRGRSAHGSVPHLGENAVYRMTHFLRHLEPRAHPKDPLEDITVNLGTIRGGSAPNVVADACAVDLDCRHPPGTTRDDVEGLLRRAIRASGEAVEFELFHEVPAAGVSADAPHVRLLRSLAATQVVGVTYATEMAHYARHNPRCVVFGPGDPQRIHVPDERVSLKETVRAAEVLAEFASRLAARRPGRERTTKSYNTRRR